MKIISKHGEQQTVVARADFTGGLNTAAQVEAIAENQLAECVNMDVDAATGKLRTVEGTVDILSDTEIFAVVYDSINSLMLVVDANKKIRLADFDGNINSETIGKLSGELYPKYCAYEDGVLIASGGHLQYFNGAEIVTLNSPKADDVFTRAGRIIIYSNSKISYSGVGDERNWHLDNNRESSAKIVEVGYKDGGNFIGLASLANNILAIKDNRRCYRLAGEFPEWQVTEFANQVECSGRRSYCNVGDEVFVLGRNEAHIIQNSLYGNVKPEDIAAQIKSEIHRLPQNSQVRYVPPLYQVWCIGKDGYVLVYDIRFKAWFKRQFNAEILDVFNVGDEVYIVKADRVSKLDKGSFKDNDEWLSWKFLAQRMVSHHDYLLKRTKISVTMLNSERYNGQIFCGKVVIPLPIPNRAMKIFEDDSPIYRNKTKLNGHGRIRGHTFPQPPNEKAFWSEEPLIDNRHKIFSNNTFEVQSKNYFRSHYLDIGGHGTGGRFILQSIVMDIAEV
ncbi:MAG: hypothetical protein IJS81_09200 [Selenomonadaceae bacterium]|nr:hypothetical protein [Selenomonadaceae bacterium]